MAAKKNRRRKRPNLAWRVLFGQHGPTKKALKKALTDMVGPKTIASIAHDPATGKLMVKNLVVDKRTGQISMAPKSKGKPAKAQPAKKAGASRASKPSKPSRAGQVQRRSSAAPVVPQAARLPKAQSMSERGIRNADGTMNGSRPDARKAALEYQRIMAHVEKLNRQTDRDLGWG